MLKVLLTSLLFVAFSQGGVAHADKVTEFTKVLKRSSEGKARISAAISLCKLGKQRSLWTFAKALKDSNKTVRAVSAACLGRIVTAGTNSKMRKAVLRRLKTSASRDTNAFVRKQARKAQERIMNPGARVDAKPICDPETGMVRVGPGRGFLPCR